MRSNYRINTFFTKINKQSSPFTQKRGRTRHTALDAVSQKQTYKAYALADQVRHDIGYLISHFLLKISLIIINNLWD